MSNKGLLVLTVLLGIALAWFALFDISGYGSIGVGWTRWAVRCAGFPGLGSGCAAPALSLFGCRARLSGSRADLFGSREDLFNGTLDLRKV